jgi:hypothetical protein
MLAIGSAWSTQPAKRSLFVWHGSEERGLWVLAILLAIPPLNCLLAAVLNGDMGRNAPDSAALLGATEPHLLLT